MIVYSFIIFLFTCIKLADLLLTTRMIVVEESPNNTIIGDLITKLPNSLKNNVNQLRFRVITSEYSKYFSVNVTTGLIRVNQRLDRESICSKTETMYSTSSSSYDILQSLDFLCQITFNVNILRVLNSGVDIVDMIHLIIEIKDVNDNVCQFLPTNKQDIYVVENMFDQTDVIKVPVNQLTDLDTGPRNGIHPSSIQLKFDQFSSVSMGEIFGLMISNTSSQVSPYSINLLIKQPLDYEKVQNFKMTVVASSLAPTISSIVNSINNKLEYEKDLKINTENDQCSLDITVHVIDVNDHPPTFLERTAYLSIMENTEKYTPIYTPKAHDLDAGPIHSQLIFELNSMNSPYIFSNFYVNSHNGSVFLKQTLNYKERSKFKILLTVRNPRLEEIVNNSLNSNNDNNNSNNNNNLNQYSGRHYYYKSLLSNTDSNLINNLLYDTMELFIEVIDVNNHKPVIAVYTPNGSHILMIQEHLPSENLPVDFALVSVTDDDNGRNGEVKCELDRNSSSLFKLTLIGYESSTDKLINENNDNNELTDFQSNDLIIYKISALVSFDREQNATVYPMIRCIDQGSDPLTTEYIAQIYITDINDNAPIFSHTDVYIRLMEDSDPLRSQNNYYVVRVNATDKDINENAEISYYILEESVQNIMIMNETTGKIKTNGHLDREMNASFSFTVIAKDLGEPSRSASVSIYITVEDYNDEYPEFNKRIYEFSIVENPVQGYYIDTIIVSDKDIDVNSELSFHLDYNDEEDITYMNNDNDNRYHQQYELRFPLYKQKRLPPFKLTSKRLNDQHTYELNLFTNGKIDREEIIRLNQRKLKIALEYNDYKNMNSEEVEELSRYKLLLTAEDSGMPKRISTVLIYINIIDVNDEAPIFISPLQEDMIYTLSINEAPGYQVLKFKANDPDDGINAKIKYSLTELSQTKLYNENESLSTCETLSFKSLKHQNTSCNLLQYLYLNQSSGSLTLIKQLPLNLLNTTCRLRVEASDMGIIPLQTTRLFCLHLMTTNDLKQVKWMSYTKQYTHSILYVYIIVAVISIGLIISLIFVCIAFTIWKYPKLEMNRTAIKESTSYDDNHQISRIRCVTEKSNTSTNEEIYHTVVCTENEWSNINPQSAEANQSQYLNKNNYYYPYFAESQYPRNQQIFESFQQNKNPSSEQLFNELNVCVNANYPLSYSSLPQHGKILFYDSL